MERHSPPCVPNAGNAWRKSVLIPINKSHHQSRVTHKASIENGLRNALSDIRKNGTNNTNIQAVHTTRDIFPKASTSSNTYDGYSRQEIECGIALSELYYINYNNIHNNNYNINHNNIQHQEQVWNKINSHEQHPANNTLKQSTIKRTLASQNQNIKIKPGNRQHRQTRTKSSTCNDDLYDLNSTRTYTHNGSEHEEIIIKSPTGVRKFYLSIKYLCKICKRTKDNLIDFNHHMRSTHKYPRVDSSLINIRYMCLDCGKKMKSRQKFRQHCYRHGDPNFECATCFKVFATKYTLRNHVKMQLCSPMNSGYPYCRGTISSYWPRSN